MKNIVSKRVIAKKATVSSAFQQIQKLGLAAAIAVFSYQPAMQASSQNFLTPSPTAPMIDTLVAAAPLQSQQKSQQIAQSLSGTFVGSGSHDATGQARIVTENGQRYLEFDQAFSSDNGPDLFVLLHREDVPSSYSAENYVNLGRLKSTNGTQRYAIPADVSLADFRSAVIWCQQFDVTFGYVTL